MIVTEGPGLFAAVRRSWGLADGCRLDLGRNCGGVCGGVRGGLFCGAPVVAVVADSEGGAVQSADGGGEAICGGVVERDLLGSDGSVRGAASFGYVVIVVGGGVGGVIVEAWCVVVFYLVTVKCILGGWVTHTPCRQKSMQVL